MATVNEWLAGLKQNDLKLFSIIWAQEHLLKQLYTVVLARMPSEDRQGVLETLYDYKLQTLYDYKLQALNVNSQSDASDAEVLVPAVSHYVSEFLDDLVARLVPK